MALVGFVLGKAKDYIVEEKVLFVKALHMHGRFGFNEINKDAEINKVSYKFLTNLILLIFIIVVGNTFLRQVEELDFFDALYSCPHHYSKIWEQKLFHKIGAYICNLLDTYQYNFFSSITFIYRWDGYEEQKISSVHWVLIRKTTIADLEAADLDYDKVVR